jgi:hypothetical protein
MHVQGMGSITSRRSRSKKGSKSHLTRMKPVAESMLAVAITVSVDINSSLVLACVCVDSEIPLLLGLDCAR